MEGLGSACFMDEKQTQKLMSAFSHNVNRILPETQEVLHVPNDMEAEEALRLMAEKGYSQVPVVAGPTVLGVFSFRSFSLRALKIEYQDVDLRKLPVDKFVVKVPFVKLSDKELKALFENVDQHDAVLVGQESRLVGIITYSNIIEYLLDIANPYLLLQEIEIGLRQLIRLFMNDDELTDSIRRLLYNKYKNSKQGIPKNLEEVVFIDYKIILTDEENFKGHFKPVFGKNINKARADLENINTIRNLAFHFRRELSVDEHFELAVYREWTLDKIASIEGSRKGGVNV